jgi:hypothetical protein
LIRGAHQLALTKSSLYCHTRIISDFLGDAGLPTTADGFEPLKPIQQFDDCPSTSLMIRAPYADQPLGLMMMYNPVSSGFKMQRDEQSLKHHIYHIFTELRRLVLRLVIEHKTPSPN